MAIASPRRVWGRTRTVETFIAGSGAAVQVAAPNGDRVAITFCVTTTITCQLSTLPGVTASTGMAIGGAQVPTTFTMSGHAGLVCGAWYAFMSAGLGGLTIIETIYLEEAGDAEAFS